MSAMQHRRPWGRSRSPKVSYVLFVCRLSAVLYSDDELEILQLAVAERCRKRIHCIGTDLPKCASYMERENEMMRKSLQEYGVAIPSLLD